MMPANLDRDEMALELIRRSYENLTGYEGEYEVTHLLNSLLCLLVLPKETFYTAKSMPVPNDSISKELLQQLQSAISEDSAEAEKCSQVNLNEIIRHIRNAICHGSIQFIGEYPPCESEQIIVHSIKFKDQDGFTIQISKNDLGQFVKEFYVWVLKQHK